MACHGVFSVIYLLLHKLPSMLALIQPARWHLHRADHTMIPSLTREFITAYCSVSIWEAEAEKNEQT